MIGERDDVELMAEVATGSTDAFAALYDRYCDRAYRVARSVCRDDGHAEDAVQEAFISIWRRRASYEAGRGTVAAYVLSIARNRAIDAVRRDGKHATHRAGEHMLENRPAPEDVAEQAAAIADQPRLLDQIRQLPREQQEVIALAFYGELTHTEIADQLALPPGTVKSRIRLGLSRLRGRAQALG